MGVLFLEFLFNFFFFFNFKDVASSKENLSGLIPTALNSKAKLNEQKNVQPNSKITKSTCSSTGTSLESSNALSTAKSMSASVISHKNEVKAKDLEYVLGIFLWFLTVYFF